MLFYNQTLFYTEQCISKAACPEGFSVVANANPNKCYLVGSDDVKNYGAASVSILF